MNVCNRTPPLLKMLPNHTRILRKISSKYGVALQNKNPLIATYSTSSDRISSAEKIILKKESYSAKEFSITSFEKEDLSDVKEFMKIHFYPRNPLCQMLHLTYEDHKDYLHHALTAKTGNGVSFIARHCVTNMVVGTCLPKIIFRNENMSIDLICANISNIKLRHCLQILELLRNSVNLFEKYNVDKILEMESGIVDETYGKKGIVHRLSKKSMKHGKALGCQLAVGQATNSISQNQLLKLGGKLEFELDFESLEINGQNVLDLTRSSGTTSAMVFSSPL